MAFVSGGKIVAKELAKQGVTHVFTLCGGHVQDIYDGCIDEKIKVIDVRHEQSAAHAADGWARVTGQPGVAIVTAGPGVTGTVTAIANALKAQSPMVVIGGQGARNMGAFGGQDMGSLQELNALEIMRPITKWAVSVPETKRLAEYVQSAFRVAKSGVPGPVFLEMPIDVLFGLAEESEITGHEGSYTDASIAGDLRHVERAARIIKESRYPVMIVGSQYRFSPWRMALLNLLGIIPIPTFLNGMARGSLPKGHPQRFKFSRAEALKDADCVIVFGTPMDFRLGYGTKINANAKVIQIDLDGSVIGRNRKIDVGIVGDSGVVMAQLAMALKGTVEKNYSWTMELRGVENEKIEKVLEEIRKESDPPNPLRVCAEINKFVDSKTIVVGDGGDFVATASYILNVEGPGNWLDPGPLGTLGVGPGYAMAAKLAKPDHKVILLMGDGSFGFNGMEFESMVRQGINVVGIIGNDACYSQIYRNQANMYGPERCVATKLDYTRYDKMVEAFGGYGEYVETSSEIKPALIRAFLSEKPALINIKIGASDFRNNSISV